MLVSYDVPVRPEFWKNLGDKGTFIDVHRLLPSDDEAHRRAARRSGRSTWREFKEEPVYGAFNAYAQVMLIADAVNRRRRATSGEDIVKALLANKFEGWNGTISFTRGDGPYWQQWTPPMLFMQYTKAGAAVRRGEDRLPAGVSRPATWCWPR